MTTGRRSPDVELRLGAASDIDAIADVERDASLRFATVLPTIAADAAVPVDDLLAAILDRRLTVALAGGLVAGYAWWSVVGGEGHLEQVSVIRALEGCGVGRRLIDWAAASANEHGCGAITLTTFADVAWNAPLYERYGFVPLHDTELGPELTARRARERDRGLEVAPRLAMRREL